MKAKPDCIPCMFRQALNTTRTVTDDPAVQARVLKILGRRLGRLSMKQSPAALSQPVYEIVSRVTGVKDPYARQKRETNAAALAMLPRLERLVKRSPDPLKAAIHLAAAGNIIDLGIGHAFDLNHDIARLMKQPFACDDYRAFVRELKPGRRLLYLGDNCGEIVFDRVLVEYLVAKGLEVTFVVKSGPIINDATLRDARDTGMTRVCPVIATGSKDIGVNWARASADFRRHAYTADLILAKGHGNFETCVGRPGNYYFLLKAKCDMVAQELRVKLGDTVFKHVSTNIEHSTSNTER